MIIWSLGKVQEEEGLPPSPPLLDQGGGVSPPLVTLPPNLLRCFNNENTCMLCLKLTCMILQAIRIWLPEVFF